MHLGCNLGKGAVSLLEAWDVGIVVGGAERKGAGD